MKPGVKSPPRRRSGQRGLTAAEAVAQNPCPTEATIEIVECLMIDAANARVTFSRAPLDSSGLYLCVGFIGDGFSVENFSGGTAITQDVNFTFRNAESGESAVIFGLQAGIEVVNSSVLLTW